MTLLLGLATIDSVVVATDGFSRLVHSDGRVEVEHRDLQKTFKLNPSTVLVHHGENKLNGTPIADVIAGIPSIVSSIRQPDQLADQLRAYFEPLLQSMAGILRRYNNGFGIWIAGFESTAFLREIWWNSNLTFEGPRFQIGEIVPGGNGKVRVFDLFNSGKFAQRGHHNLTQTQAQEFIHALFFDAAKLQTDPVFGGDYHETTINQYGITERIIKESEESDQARGGSTSVRATSSGGRVTPAG